MNKKIVYFFLILLTIVLILDPSDRIFHAKIPLFLLVFFFWIIKKTKNSIVFRKDVLTIVLYFFLISIYGVIISTVQMDEKHIDYIYAIGFLKSICILLMLVVTIDLNIFPDLMLNKYALLIPLVTIFIYIVSIYEPALFLLIYEYVVRDKEIIMISNRNFYGYELFSIYYKTSPLLVFPLSFYCNEILSKNRVSFSFFIVAVITFTLFLSGTRANIVAAVFVLIFYTYKFIKKKNNIYYYLVAYISVFTAAILFFLSLSFDDKEPSAEIKGGHLTSMLKTIEENPQYLVWGQGLGSLYYTTGSDALTPQTELTYFELARIFGIPLFLFFFILLLYPVYFLFINKKITNRNRYTIVAYFVYLFIAGTNPLLISSTGMLILVIMFSFLRQQQTDSITIVKNEV